MKAELPLIDFFDRVYRPLKLAGHRSEAEACRKAIEALSTSLGREATLRDLVGLNPAPMGLSELQAYAHDLGVLPAAPITATQTVFYRGQTVFVPIGEPTPHEIDQRGAEIRQGWNEGETRARAGRDRHVETTWQPPGCAQYASTPFGRDDVATND